MSEIIFGKIEEIEDSKVLVKRFGRNRIAVCKYKDSFYAFKDACSHDNAPFNQSEICENIIQCPRHGSKFDITNGNFLSPPAFSNLTTYSVKIQEGNIKVILD